MTRPNPPTETLRIPLLLAAASLGALLLAAGAGAALAGGVGVDAPRVTDVHWGAWRASTVSSDGFSSSIAVAPNGTPYIAYHTGDALLMVHRTVEGWVREELPVKNSQDPEIVVDGEGDLHATFRLGLGGDAHVYYAHRPGGKVGAWSVTVLDTGVLNLRPTIALGPSGAPAVGYIKDDTLHYAEKASTGWSIETVGPAFSDPELAIDDEGDPRIAYHPADDAPDVAYAEREEGSWSTQTVEELCGFRLDIALGPDDEPHIACRDENRGMAHLWRTGGAWKKEIVDDGSHAVFEREGNTLASATIAVDGDGRPHIAYRYDPNFASPRTSPGQPHYAVKVGGEWQVEVVDRDGQHNGDEMSIALDSQGYPHLSYVRDNRFEGGGGFPGSGQLQSLFDVRYARPLPAELAWQTGT